MFSWHSSVYLPGRSTLVKWQYWKFFFRSASFCVLWLQNSVIGFNFNINSISMNKKLYSFLLRFSFFLVVFGVAFFLMIFVVDKNPAQNLQMLLIKIGILATFASLFFNILFESGPEIVDWMIRISSCTKH